MKAFKQYVNESSTKQYKKAIVELEAKEEHLIKVLSILKTMSKLGRDGSSRTIKIFVDGDGAFNMRVKSDTEIESVEYDDDDIEFELE